MSDDRDMPACGTAESPAYEHATQPCARTKTQPCARKSAGGIVSKVKKMMKLVLLLVALVALSHGMFHSNLIYSYTYYLQACLTSPLSYTSPHHNSPYIDYHRHSTTSAASNIYKASEDAQFQEFVQKYNKKYTAGEYPLRFANFQVGRGVEVR